MRLGMGAGDTEQTTMTHNSARRNQENQDSVRGYSQNGGGSTGIGEAGEGKGSSAVTEIGVGDWACQPE